MRRPVHRLIGRAHCQRIGVPYLSTGIVDSYAQGMRYMHEVGHELREAGTAPTAVITRC